MRAAPALAVLLALAAPLAARPPTGPTAWKLLITPRDRMRFRLWRDALVAGLAQARAGGAGAQVDALGALLEPDAALPDPLPPAGDYACRTVKLGTLAPGGPVFADQAGLHCRIAGDQFAQIDGGQRPAGRLWPLDGVRALFLGALTLGDERAGLAYGRDDDRNMVGVVERIGDARWRIVLPRPRWQSQVDVVELVPAS